MNKIEIQKEIKRLAERIDNMKLTADNITMADGTTVEESISGARTSLIASINKALENV